MTKNAVNELRNRLKANDRTAYQHLLENCGHFCIHKLMRKTGCAYEDAEDILMDAVLIFRENILSGKVVQISSLKAYVFSICFNKWSEYRREKQRRSLAIAKSAAAWAPPEPNIEEQIVAQEDFATAQAKKERQQAISQAAFSALGTKCQKILQYFYVEDKSMAEIATLLNYANAKVAKNLKARCYKKWIALAHQKMEMSHEK